MDHTQFTHDNRRRPKHPFPKKATYRSLPYQTDSAQLVQGNWLGDQCGNSIFNRF